VIAGGAAAAAVGAWLVHAVAWALGYAPLGIAAGVPMVLVAA
jgi:hypothetical protein